MKNNKLIPRMLSEWNLLVTINQIYARMIHLKYSHQNSMNSLCICTCIKLLLGDILQHTEVTF